MLKRVAQNSCARWTFPAALLAVVGLAYRRSIRRARERVGTGSRLVVTPVGPLEVAALGDGAPVLAIHGAGGGFDQALEVAGPLARHGFRVVAMSRFGYLGTPLPAGASVEAQADAHAHLLDALGLERVAVVGASAGAPSAMQLALRHPERVGRLVLLVPLAYPVQSEERRAADLPERRSRATQALFDAALGSDFLFWLATRLAYRSLVRTVLGTPPSLLRTASAAERERIRRVLEHIQPLSRRGPGLLNDAAIARSLPRYDLERIAAPTLVLAVEDCLYGTYPGARHTADHIPDARFVSYPTGGHLWVGHERDVIREVLDFLTGEPRDARADPRRRPPVGPRTS